MSLILLPALVLMLITMLVWSNLFVRRIIAVKAAGLNIQDYPTPEKFNEVLSDRVQAPANCFRNLTEAPVIFYALTAFIAISSASDALFINLAWSFVGLRSLQACVHCTYNRVMHRFYAYLVSCIVLWVMVIRFFLMVV